MGAQAFLAGWFPFRPPWCRALRVPTGEPLRVSRLVHGFPEPAQHRDSAVLARTPRGKDAVPCPSAAAERSAHLFLLLADGLFPAEREGSEVQPAGPPAQNPDGLAGTWRQPAEPAAYPALPERRRAKPADQHGAGPAVPATQRRQLFQIPAGPARLGRLPAETSAHNPAGPAVPLRCQVIPATRGESGRAGPEGERWKSGRQNPVVPAGPQTQRAQPLFPAARGGPTARNRQAGPGIQPAKLWSPSAAARPRGLAPSW